MMTHQDRALDDVRNTLGEYVRILQYRWRLALIGIGVIGSLAFWYSQYLPRRYSASTVFERRDDVVLRNLIDQRSPYSFGNLKSTMAMDMTGSRAQAEAAVAVGILPETTLPGPGEAMSESALQALDAALVQYELRPAVRLLHSSPDLDTIHLSCEANNPELAQRFVVALRDRYVDSTRDRITDILTGARDFFIAEVERYRIELQRSNESMAQPFEEFPGLDPNDVVAVGNRLEVLRQERTRLLERRAELEAQIRAREQLLIETAVRDADEAATTTPTGVALGPSQSEAVILQAIKGLENELTERRIVRRMTEEHPEVKALRRKQLALYEQIEQLRGDGTPTVASASPALTDTPKSAQRLRCEMELEALRPQLELVQTSFGAADQRVERFAALYEQLLGRDDELRKLREKIEQDRSTMALWRQHISELDRILSADTGQRGTQFALLEEPKGPTRAINPRLSSVFAVCTGSGLAAAALLVALAELLDRSFRTTGQVARALGIPVLESVGVIATPEVRRKRLISRAVWTPTLAVLLIALLLAGTLAYTSLQRPEFHEQALTRLETVLPSSILPARAGGMTAIGR
jgi:hypothetical protein